MKATGEAVEARIESAVQKFVGLAEAAAADSEARVGGLLETRIGSALTRIVAEAETRLAAFTPPTASGPSDEGGSKRALSSPERSTPGHKRGRTEEGRDLPSQKRKNLDNMLAGVVCCLQRLATGYDGKSVAVPDELCQRILATFSRWPTCGQQFGAFLMAGGLEGVEVCFAAACCKRWDELQPGSCRCHKLNTELHDSCLRIRKAENGEISLFWSKLVEE